MGIEKLNKRTRNLDYYRIFYISIFVLCLLLTFSLASATDIIYRNPWDLDKTTKYIMVENMTNTSLFWETNLGDLDDVNITQFENDGGTLSILESWLTSFIEGISKWANYYTKTESDERYLQEETDPNYFSNPLNYINESYNDNWINDTFYNKTESNNNYVNLTGDTMQGDLDMNSNNITSVDYLDTTTLKLNSIGSTACDLSVSGTMCKNSTATYIVG
jgi:hypothetical protein